MATFDLGQTVTWGLKTYSAAGALADVGTGPTATVHLPDGTTASAVVVKTATGTYTASLTSTQAGRHRVVWAGSGANSGGLPYSDHADVWPADPRLVISLADARAALNLASSNTTSDDEVRLYIAAAAEIIEDIAGPVLSASVTETHSGSGKFGLPLWKRAAAVTGVTEDGDTLAATDYAYDEVAGVLWRGSQPGAGFWSDTSPGNVVVTMTVGASAVPPNVVLAARELVRHLYAIGQQPWRAPYGGGLEDVATITTPSGYAVPARVVDLLKPQAANRMPGFA